jgi:predicted metalloprotease
MRWRKVEGPTNVEDRRRRGRKTAAAGGAVGGLGIIGAILFALLSGGGGGGLDLESILGSGLQGAQPPAGGQDLANAPDPDAELLEFMRFLDVDIQGTWEEIFASAQRQYNPATFVIFEQATPSDCGGANAAIGPHYCSLDDTVYLDFSFFDQLRSRFGAGGDFAQAYVIAHEYAHHVQNELGIMGQVQSVSRTASTSERNDLSVRQELQADCFAGVWAHTAVANLEPGDIDEAITAAEAVGDDRIQQAAQGYINPESWTHGSSAQRAKWFSVGFDTGDPNQCDTFSGGL